MKRINWIIILVLTLISSSLSSCKYEGDGLNIYRKLEGKSENFHLIVECWVESDGNQYLDRETYYDAADLYCLTRLSVENKGYSEFDTIVISKISFCDANWQANYYGEPNYANYFQNNRFCIEKIRELSCLNNESFTAEIVFENGDTETITADLIRQQGEISDLNISF